MNRLHAIFKKKKAFVGYLTAGHMGLHYTEQAACALVNGGVDILEIGLPFSDPTADGPVIQHAMEDALARGTHVDAALECIMRIKKRTTAPVVLFTYYNLLHAKGLSDALQCAKQAGVDAVLVVDLPLEASKPYLEHANKHKLDTIGLISPSSNERRIEQISRAHHGFLYYVCRHGTTGIKPSLPQDYAAKLARIRGLTESPIVSGFGIGTRALAADAIQHADGFVVGSAFVKAISDGKAPNDLQQLAAHIKPRRTHDTQPKT